MPRYYIDTSDDDCFCRDKFGWEFADLEAAKFAALAALPEMAKDKLPGGGDARTFLAIVRNADGEELVQTSRTLNVTMMSPAGPV